MSKDGPVKITSSPQKGLSTEVTIDRKRYLVLTEDLGIKKHCVTTRVYLGGEVISSMDRDYKDIVNVPDINEKLGELLYKQHELALALLKAEKMKEMQKPSDYLDEVKTLLQGMNHKGALEKLVAALKEYPDDPFLLSYYGCLEAIVNKNYVRGIDTCLKAIKILNGWLPFGQEFFYPVFYLNLGRAYLAAGDRKKAIEVFCKGLTFDGGNRELLREVRKLGIRRKPVVPFLPRSHFINKYIGMVLHKLRRD